MAADSEKTREELLAELEESNRRLARLTETVCGCPDMLADGDSLYKSLADATFEAIFLSDKGVCIGQNRAARLMFGYSDEEALGRLGTEWIHPEHRETAMQHMLDGEEGPYEVVALRRDGSTFPCEIRASMTSRGGQPVRVTVLRDITARKEAESLREDFERMFRHDMRTPLAGIMSAPKVLMAEGNLSPFQKELLEAVEEASYKMLGMLRISLALPKLERGAFEPEVSVFELGGLLRRILGLQGAFARSKDIRTVLESGPWEGARSRGQMEGDEILLFSMFTNLVRNALEAAPEGGEVGIRYGCSGGVARIDIGNPGWVPADMRKTFFDKYSTRGKPNGQGLGTYSALLVATAHGGTIELDTSEPGQVKVRVDLPERLP